MGEKQDLHCEYKKIIEADLGSAYEYKGEDKPKEGGAGIVFKITKKNTKNPYAIKFLKKEKIDDNAFIETFCREIEQLKELRHNNVITIIDYKADSDAYYYIMDYANGGTLEDYFETQKGENGKPDHNLLPRFLRGIVEGLGYIHGKERIHFDIKPDNIFVNDEIPKIGDLGVMKIVGETTGRNGGEYVATKKEMELATSSRSDIITTRNYTHPELLGLINTYSGKVPYSKLQGKYYFDFYSLGITLKELRAKFSGFHKKQLELLNQLILRLTEDKEVYGEKLRYRKAEDILLDITKLDPLYLQTAGVAELAPTFVNTSPCRIPVSDNVALSDTIIKILDTPVMQRLRNFPQLELVNFVYPGANHTRFEHSLGTYERAREILINLLVDPVANVLLSKKDINTVLIAALINNVGVYPFANVLEEMPNWPLRKDEIKKEIINGSGGQQAVHFSKLLSDIDGIELGRLSRIVCRKRPAYSDDPRDKVLFSILHGTLGAKRLDFIQRDSIHCGIPYGMMGDKERFLASIVLNEKKFELAISEKGLASAESYILAYCTMIRDVYWHHTVRALSCMLKEVVGSALKNSEFNNEATLRSMVLEKDANGFLDFVKNHVDNKVGERLLEPLKSGAKRKIYKRLLTLRNKGVSGDSRYENNIMWQNLSKPENADAIKNMIIEEARVVFEGKAVDDYDILLDIPKEYGLDNVRNLHVCYPELDQEKAIDHPISEISLFNAELFQNLTVFLKKIRVFINPDIILDDKGKVFEDKVREVRERIYRNLEAYDS